MVSTNNLFISSFLMLAALNVHAEPISSALQETQNCLENQTCDSINTEAGKSADQRVQELVGNNQENRQALYKLSADIMPGLIQQTGGDPDKMQAIMHDAQNDPEKFLNSLPADTQLKIKAVASSLEKAKTK
jgi:hypothetical protein